MMEETSGFGFGIQLPLDVWLMIAAIGGLLALVVIGIAIATRRGT